MICWILTAFFTSILFSWSVARYIAACVRVWVFAYIWDGYTYFGQKLIESTNKKFLGVSKETTAILDPCITASNILNRREKNLPSLPKKWVREKKRKVTGAVKLSRSHPSAKIRKGFWKHQYLINVYSTGTLPQLISRIT